MVIQKIYQIYVMACKKYHFYP